MAGFDGNDTLSGSEGHDTLDGRNGNDVLMGGAGHDLLTGGYGDDRFVFSGNFGFDVITDFSAGARAGDVLQLSLGGAYDSFAEVIAVASQVNADTVFDFGGLDCITLQNVRLASLNADDFLFAA
jgi:Ca2+-binding RTX toxin-like protein